MDTKRAALTIHDMAERTGVSAHTLRYYERVGLLDSVARTVSGRRRYSAADVEWVRLLICLRQTGMDIRAMLRFVAAVGSGLAVA